MQEIALLVFEFWVFFWSGREPESATGPSKIWILVGGRPKKTTKEVTAKRYASKAAPTKRTATKEAPQDQKDPKTRNEHMYASLIFGMGAPSPHEKKSDQRGHHEEKCQQSGPHEKISDQRSPNEKKCEQRGPREKKNDQRSPRRSEMRAKRPPRKEKRPKTTPRKEMRSKRLPRKETRPQRPPTIKNVTKEAQSFERTQVCNGRICWQGPPTKRKAT